MPALIDGEHSCTNLNTVYFSPSGFAQEGVFVAGGLFPAAFCRFDFPARRGNRPLRGFVTHGETNSPSVSECRAALDSQKTQHKEKSR